MNKPIPALLRTYEEARLLMEAKGWGLAKAAEHLAAQPELKKFKVSQASLSRKTSPRVTFPIESEVAAAIEGLETQNGYERLAGVVTAGLRAVHGAPPIVDVRQLAKDLREHLPANELALNLVTALEEKARQGPLLETLACSIAGRLRASQLVQELVERVGRLSWKQVAIPAAVGALVACLTLLVLPARALPIHSASQLVVIVTNPVSGGSPAWFEPGSLLAMGEKVPERRYDQPIPTFTLPGQKVAPCDAELGEVAIHGNCWAWQGAVKPPCGRIFRHGDKCYRPIAADPQKPVEPAPDRPSAP